MSDLTRLTSALADRYRIERELGQGGMATVYLAEDVRHHRKVAVKLLHPELSAVLGPDRFLKEIELTANLQHPHILPLFDSGAVEGLLYYVMPFVEGETLRSRLAREHQLPITEAVRIATDVADALEYAHKRGVVHRDIKPENILLHEGRPQVADFGIALAVQQAGGSRMTQTGMSLGTPQYMAPEQAMGDKGVDARADVYALGAVTYEMLTGEPPFTGPTAQAIVAKVMTETPRSLASQRPSVPVDVEGAVLTALEKLPADRFSTAAEFAAALRGVGASGAAHTSRRRGPAALSWWRDPRSRIALGAIGVLVLLASGALLWRPSEWRDAPSPPMVARLPLAGEPIVGALGDVLTNADRPSRTALAISPDGTALVYVGQRGQVRQLFLRPLLGETATPIAGTEGAESPFFSPDGRFAGYWAAGLLMRASFAGGLPTRIAAVERISGASWGEDGRIVVGVQDVGLLRFSATGSAKPDTLAGPGAILPQVLPGGKAIVFSMQSGSGPGRYSVDLLTLAGGERKRLLDDAADARVLATGHLVFGRGGTMLAVPFDPRALTVTGSPTVVLPDVMQALGGYNTGVLTGAMQAASSPLGQLVYVSGGVTPDRRRKLVWLDRQGHPTPITTVGERPFFAARLSPDGTRAAVTALGKESVLYVLDLQRGSEQSLTDPGLQLWPLWTQDGRRILRAGMVRDTSAIVWSPADGSRPAAPLIGNSVLKGQPAFWSPDGTALFLMGTGDALYGVTLAGGAIRKVENLPEDASYQVLSPDGKWLAYAATEPGSGRQQVFVQPWPALDRKWKVSTEGGSAPVWTRAGRELIYLREIGTDSTGDPDLSVMSVTVDPGTDFAPRTPSELFKASFGNTTPLRNYDVTANGDRFLVIKGARSSAPAGEPRVIVNWFSELRRLSVPQRSNP